VACRLRHLCTSPGGAAASAKTANQQNARGFANGARRSLRAKTRCRRQHPRGAMRWFIGSDKLFFHQQRRRRVANANNNGGRFASASALTGDAKLSASKDMLVKASATGVYRDGVWRSWRHGVAA